MLHTEIWSDHHQSVWTDMKKQRQTKSRRTVATSLRRFKMLHYIAEWPWLISLSVFREFVFITQSSPALWAWGSRGDERGLFSSECSSSSCPLCSLTRSDAGSRVRLFSYFIMSSNIFILYHGKSFDSRLHRKHVRSNFVRCVNEVYLCINSLLYCPLCMSMWTCGL